MQALLNQCCDQIKQQDAFVVVLHNVTQAPWSCDLFALLSHHEQQVAKSLPAVRCDFYQKQRFIRRYFLAAFMDCDIRAVQYGVEQKRPFVINDHSVCFSVSHAADSFSMIITQGGLCGIDIEHMRNVYYKKGISQRFFCPQEQHMLAKCDYSDEAFFNIWTRKEALIKMLGKTMYRYARQYDTCDGERCAHNVDQPFLIDTYAYDDVLLSIAKSCSEPEGLLPVLDFKNASMRVVRAAC